MSTDLDYDALHDSRPLRPPTVDERVRDLEVLHDAKGREMIDFHSRLKNIEGIPGRVAWAVIAGAVGMMITIAGSAYATGAQLARMESSIDALTARVSRLEDRIDRIESRSWSSHRGEE